MSGLAQIAACVVAIALPPLRPPLAGAGDEVNKKAREVIDRAIAAKGGKRLLAWLPACYFKYRETFFRDRKEEVESGEVFEDLARGRARYNIEPDLVIVIDGDESWTKKGAKVTPLEPGQVANFKEYLKAREGLLQLLPLLTDDWQLAHLGEKEIDGKRAAVLRLKAKSGWTATTYWDLTTHLLVRADYVHKRLMETDEAKRKPSPREVYFRDYKEIAGVKFHQTVEAFSGDRRVSLVNLRAIEFLEWLPKALFVKPTPTGSK